MGLGLRKGQCTELFCGLQEGCSSEEERGLASNFMKTQPGPGEDKFLQMNTLTSSTTSLIPFVPHSPPTPAALPHLILQLQNQLHWDSSLRVALGFSLGTSCHRGEGKTASASRKWGKRPCQPGRIASVLSPANAQHPECHKDEGAHGPAQEPVHTNTPNDTAPCAIAKEAHLLPTLF